MITKQIFAILIIAIGSLFSLTNVVHAISSSEISDHNTPEDCWMVFEDKVYDTTDYLEQHDGRMDIRDWCGKDMTEDFKSKGGRGKDHKPQGYADLAELYIGDVDGDLGLQGRTIPSSNPYNFSVPFLVVIVVYFFTRFLSGREFAKTNLFFRKSTVRLFWNSIMVASLVPSVFFGFFMIARLSFSALQGGYFNFLWWHVEGSIVFATVVILHFLERWAQYVAPLRVFRKRKG